MHHIGIVESRLKMYFYSLFNSVQRSNGIHKSTNNKKRSPHAFDGHFFTVIVGKWRESNCSHLFSYDCVQTISLLEKKLKMNSTELTCDNFKPPEASSVIKTRTFFEQKNFFFWNSIF